jgi:hypothetical protein
MNGSVLIWSSSSKNPQYILLPRLSLQNSWMRKSRSNIQLGQKYVRDPSGILVIPGKLLKKAWPQADRSLHTALMQKIKKKKNNNLGFLDPYEFWVHSLFSLLFLRSKIYFYIKFYIYCSEVPLKKMTKFFLFSFF